MIIRKEINHDINNIEELTLQAFTGHPHHAPGSAPTEHFIVNKLREAGAMTLSLVAEDNDKIIGHLAYSPVRINGLQTRWHALAPVSVSPQHQNKGIGSQMIRQSIALLKEQQIDGLVVMGEPGYYSRFGFHHHHDFTVDGVPAEYFMMLSLNNHDKNPAGIITFHPAFD